MMVDLETIETQALIDELRRRSEAFVCVFRPIASKFPDEWRLSLGGEEDRVILLLVRAINDMLNPAPDDDADDEADPPPNPFQTPA